MPPKDSHKTPFSKDFYPILDEQIKRVENGKYSLIVIDGQMGEGKTTLGVHIADYINQKKGLPPVSLEANDHPQLAQGGEQFQEYLRQCYEKKLPSTIYDESGDFSRRGSMSKFNRELNRTFQTFRAFKIIVILILPTVQSLDASLLTSGIMRVLFHTHSRTTNSGHIGAYPGADIYYLLHSMKNLIITPEAYIKQRPRIRGVFYNLPPERAKKLDAISTNAKINILRHSQATTSGLHDSTSLTQNLGISGRTLRTKIKKLGHKPITRIGRKKYYSENTLQALKNS